MVWTDVNDIAIALEEAHPHIDVQHIRFTDLYKMIIDLSDFKGEPNRCNEKILEAVQMAWLDERR